MPQCQNMKTSDTPYGKGSLHNSLLDATFRTRRRAAQINRGESSRQHLIEHMLNKHYVAAEMRNDNVIQKVKRRAEELGAYKNVLKSYSADNMHTLQWGFKPRNINTARTFQRYKIETKIYNCGFTIGTLYPEIRRAIEDGKPEKKKAGFQKDLLKVAKRRSDFMIDRKVTDKAMRQEKRMESVQPVLFLTNEDTIIEDL